MTDSAENRPETVAPFSVLMVCTGNICRSPMAEGLLKAMLPEAGPVSVGSAGTMPWWTAALPHWPYPSWPIGG
jgi:hypothetical protein